MTAAAVPFAHKFTVDENGCWIWTGTLNEKGYGHVWVRPPNLKDQVVRKAHRVMYEALVGPIPEGLELDHLCRVRACVNPAHLEPVTHRENVLRGSSVVATNATKTRCVRGHEFTATNTQFYASPSTGRTRRVCLACAAARNESRRRVSKARFDLAAPPADEDTV